MLGGPPQSKNTNSIIFFSFGFCKFDCYEFQFGRNSRCYIGPEGTYMERKGFLSFLIWDSIRLGHVFEPKLNCYPLATHWRLKCNHQVLNRWSWYQKNHLTFDLFWKQANVKLTGPRSIHFLFLLKKVWIFFSLKK